MDLKYFDTIVKNHLASAYHDIPLCNLEIFPKVYHWKSLKEGLYFCWILKNYFELSIVFQHAHHSNTGADAGFLKRGGPPLETSKYTLNIDPWDQKGGVHLQISAENTLKMLFFPKMGIQTPWTPPPYPPMKYVLCPKCTSNIWYCRGVGKWRYLPISSLSVHSACIS